MGTYYLACLRSESDEKIELQKTRILETVKYFCRSNIVDFYHLIDETHDELVEYLEKEHFDALIVDDAQGFTENLVELELLTAKLWAARIRFYEVESDGDNYKLAEVRKNLPRYKKESCDFLGVDPEQDMILDIPTTEAYQVNADGTLDISEDELAFLMEITDASPKRAKKMLREHLTSLQNDIEDNELDDELEIAKRIEKAILILDMAR